MFIQTVFRAVGLLTFALLIAGCTSVRKSDTARTGVEQLLISSAVDRSLEKMDFPLLAGRRVYLEDKYLECVDKGYLMASLRRRLWSEGAVVVDAKDQSEVVIEVRSGGIGTDNTDSFVGSPRLAVPGPMPLDLPEVRLWERTSQYGTAKLGLIAYATDTNQMLFDSGKSLARSDDSRWSFLGIGPFQRGTLRRELRQAEERAEPAVQVARDFELVPRF